ncbi:MAG: YhcH/YjgK/YiaL family protein [Sulfurimonas sp.]|uniref:YhcH/YjgK/YiaL family protein n=1 Tax=Sulfurimonas sp. TaxID=2022749 RepID=UPI00262355C4|nr:YhcH/YjgK/YiaL family protein [Sulfurimonas sp.]MDD2652045.1 YhcH/YjgK/YiaL family protein [Sulfurimonas sp.]MDD3452046.1 YhcH/YjgK/YiaL family protein [Sulfurimonas sp.]
MVADKIEKWQNYPFGKAWQKAFAFLNTLTPTTKDAKYEIDGDDIFAIVMSYNTLKREDAVIESHQKYVDIQATLRGIEGFECFGIDTLAIKTPYDAAKDIAFYEKNAIPHSRINVTEGCFVMFFPHDAHMPCLRVADKHEHIKKVVIKIKAELLNYSSSSSP